MVAALVNRRLAATLGTCVLAGVFVAFACFERPGLGIGNFFYPGICLIALATGTAGGAIAGMLAAGLFALAMVLDPRIPSREALATGTGIRAITFALVGALVGLYAARNRELVARLREHASRDFVTGAANVRVFDEELRRRFETSQFSLALVDVDGLRKVNEVHGHRAGDVALRAVSAALDAACTPEDFVARVGGDEFALLTSLLPEQLPALIARVNATLSAHDLSVTSGAVASPDAETADDLFKRADDRLFAAKLVGTSRRRLATI